MYSPVCFPAFVLFCFLHTNKRGTHDTILRYRVKLSKDSGPWAGRRELAKTATFVLALDQRTVAFQMKNVCGVENVDRSERN